MLTNKEDWVPCFVDVEKGLSFFDGIYIEADSMNSPKWDRVLPVVEEEHILMCREMKRHGRVQQGKLAIDIGTGNGVLAIWAAKHGCKVLAIDINPRAISIAKRNAQKNNIRIYLSFEELLESPSLEAGICFSLEEFNENFDKNCLFDLVLFVPAYNLAFKGLTLPLHASAGEDGQKAFNKYIRLIPNLLKDNGCLIGNQLSTVNHQKNIKAISKIIDAFENQCQVFYTHIIDSEHYYPTAEFLQAQYLSFLNISCQQYLSKIKNIQELKEYIKNVAQDSPYLSLIYYEVVKNSQIKIEDNIQANSIPYDLPPYITWQHRTWLHRHVVEYTAERNYSLVHSLFVDAFPVNHTGYDASSCENNSDRWEKSLLRLIDTYLRRKTSWPNFNLFDFILIDTAPIDTSSIQNITNDRYRSLTNETKIWLNKSLQDINTEGNYKLVHNLLKQYQLVVSVLQKAKLSPFLHPCFTGILPIEDWGLSYNSSLINNEGLYINLYSLEETAIEKKYQILFELFEKELQDNECEYSDEMLQFLIEERVGYSSTNFKELAVPSPREFYEALLDNKRFPKSPEYKLLLKPYDNSLVNAIKDSDISLELKAQIVDLLKIDLELIILTMHKQINKSFIKTFKENDCLLKSNSNSILIGLPLGIQVDNNDLTEDDLPDSYRGCIWFYARTSANWTIEHEKFINDLARFAWLLYMDKNSLIFGQKEQEIAKKETSARLALLHQLPKDITALDEHLSNYGTKMTEFQRKYPELESELPKFSKPDSLGVVLMFTKAAQDRQLIEMPKDCAEILYREWNQSAIEEFINRVVWTQAKNRALNYPEVKAKNITGYGVVEIDRMFFKPKLILDQDFKLESPQGIYPLLVLALRSAYQHSYKMTLLSDNPSAGEVKLEYCNRELIITNTGLYSQEGVQSTNQQSWERDLKILEGLTGKWKFHNFGDKNITQCSIYDSKIQRWITKITQ